MRSSLLVLTLATAAASEPSVVVDTLRVRDRISPLVYGVNFGEQTGANGTSYTWGPGAFPWTLNRFGGDLTSTFNWETGFSNGSTYKTRGGGKNFANLVENLGVRPGVGAAVAPRIAMTFAKDAAFVATVPLTYAARDASGPQPAPAAPAQSRACFYEGCPGTPDAAHWLRALPRNPAGATASPDASDAYVYSDDFVKWLDAHYPQAWSAPRKQILIELDNEPDIWHATHPEIRGLVDGQPASVPTGWDELWRLDLAHAKAIKRVAPDAVVIGGAFAQWDGLLELGHLRQANHTSPPQGYAYYLDYFLDKLRNDDVTLRNGRSIDVLDVHWYPHGGARYGGQLGNDWEAQTPELVQIRENAPRSLWDPEYVEPNSWVTQAIPDGDHCVGRRCPVALLPRLRAHLDHHYPGTKLALLEYYFYRGGDIQGAIATADTLGILGAQGVYAAAAWPAGNPWAYKNAGGCGLRAPCVYERAYACVRAAFSAYRDYDGAGGTFGDTAVTVTVRDALRTATAERLTAYASVDAGKPDRVVLVLINKDQAARLSVPVTLAHSVPLRTARVYRITGENGGPGGCVGPARQPDLALADNTFTADLPPQSITVLAITR